MAGVGPDAAEYKKDDPRAGIFGYDRQTRKEDVKDGLSNTIFAIQTDPALAGPWIAGGGSTVRGTSEKGDRDVGFRGGFLSPNYGGKEGVWVLMADGSTRFLTKGVSPDIFKRLCTMAGGDDVGDVEGIAPKVNLPVIGQAPKANVKKDPAADKKDATAEKPGEGDKKPADPAKDDKSKPKKPVVKEDDP
jgi:hypothetical protein